MATDLFTTAFAALLLATACAAEGASGPEDSENAGTGMTGNDQVVNTGGTASAAAGSTSNGGSSSVSGGTTGSSGGTSASSGGSTSSTGGTTSTTGGTFGSGGGSGSNTSNPTCTPAGGTSAMTTAGGYVTSGGFQGYAWTAKDTLGSTINPDDFSMLSAGSALCACGTVKGTTNYDGVAMIGVNLNQPTTGGAAATVVPSGTGISVTVSGAGTTPLRLQIQGPDGATDETQRWCADIPSTGGTVAWSDFQFECWQGGMQVPFDGTSEVVAAMVLVPGGTADIPFNFCVTDLSGY